MLDKTHEGESAWANEETQSNYDRLSRWYDLLANRSERPYRDLGLRNLALQPGESVLDIGCGTGHALVAMSRVAGQVYGLDLSWGMLTTTRQRLDKNELGGDAAIIQGDAIRLPFANGTLDAAFMSFTLELFTPDKIPIVLEECRRVLRPTGRVAIVALAKRRKDNLMTRLYERAHKRWPGIIDCTPIRLSEEIMKARFDPKAVLSTSMWGLPVDVVVASVAT